MNFGMKIRLIYSGISHFFAEKKNKIIAIFPYVFITYFIFNFASYFLGGISFLQEIVYSSLFEYGSKLISYFVMLSYCLIFFIANKPKFSKTTIILTFTFIIVVVLSAIIIPKRLTITTVNGYNLQIFYELNIGIKELIIGLVNSIIDILFACFLVFVFPKYIAKETIKPFLLFVTIFTIFECFYSFIFQFKEYLHLLTGKATQGYDTSISGSFFSKNGFGFLLFQGTISTFALLFLAKKKNSKILYSIFIGIIHLVTILSLCKTSAICILLFDLLIFIYYFEKMYYENIKRFRLVHIICILLVIIIFVGLIFVSENVPVIGGLVQKVKAIFLGSGNASLNSRFKIWSYSFSLIKYPNIIFGYGKTTAPYFLRLVSNFSTQTFHNSILDLIISYGYVGIFFFIYLIFSICKSNLLLEQNGVYKILFVATLVSSLLYGMTENVIVLMSSSSVLITANMLLITKPDKPIRKGQFYEFQI